MPRWYFEDLTPGLSHEATRGPITAEAIKAFAREFDPQPFHVDEEAAKKSPFGRLCASGWHTVSLSMRMAVDMLLNDSSSIGSPGVDQVRWTRPLYAGDTIHLKATILESKASASKPNQGSVRFLWELTNQDKELLMRLEAWAMFARRPK